MHLFWRAAAMPAKATYLLTYSQTLLLLSAACQPAPKARPAVCLSESVRHSECAQCASTLETLDTRDSKLERQCAIAHELSLFRHANARRQNRAAVSPSHTYTSPALATKKKELRWQVARAPTCGVHINYVVCWSTETRNKRGYQKESRVQVQ